ncbi:pantetheinase-like [Cherax quadricarinatus]
MGYHKLLLLLLLLAKTSSSGPVLGDQVEELQSLAIDQMNETKPLSGNQVDETSSVSERLVDEASSLLGSQEDESRSLPGSQLAETKLPLGKKIGETQSRDSNQLEGRVTPVDDVGSDTQESVEYTAAVLEYEPYSSWESGGLALLQKNAHNYVHYATLAKEQGADIMVFPEYGLSSTDVSGGEFLSLTQLVPHPADHVLPCHLPDNNFTQIMRDLSCCARDLGMYLVVDLIEQEPNTDVTTQPDTHNNDSGVGRRGRNQNSLFQHKIPGEQLSSLENGKDKAEKQLNECTVSGYSFYNTQVVFDRSGVVISRYRKKHLFLEPEFTPGTDDDDVAIFTTDFGVTFTLQICFDIMYESPGLRNVMARGVRDVAMSTAWIDELPFLTAPQIFSGWSSGLEVNLLVANYHDPTTSKLGSGIFRGVSSQAAVYTYDHHGGTTLLVAPVSTLGTRLRVNQPSTTTNSTHYTRESSSGFSIAAVGTTESFSDHDYASYQYLSTDLQSNSSDASFKEFLGSFGISLIQPKSRVSEGATEQTRDEDKLYFINENLERYNHRLLEGSERERDFKTLCHNDSLCCTVTYSYQANLTDEGFYVILAYSGVVEKGAGVYSMFTQVCAVVYCLTENITSCARIEGTSPGSSSFQPYELVGTFHTEHVYPSVFTQQLTLVNESFWSFNSARIQTENECSIVLSHFTPHLLSLSLFGRWYERDPDM